MFHYSIGDIIETYDDQIGMIIDMTNAHDFMAFEKNVKDPIIRSYAHIAIYKTLIDGKITYVNDSNIRGIVECEKRMDEK